MKYVSFSATGISFFCLAYFISCHACISYPFHSLPWGISYPPCWIFHCLPGVIFYHFISCPGEFHSHLIAFFITWQVQFIYPFHSLPWAISYPPCCIFHCLPGAIFIHFIPCSGLFYTLLIYGNREWPASFCSKHHYLSTC